MFGDDIPLQSVKDGQFILRRSDGVVLTIFKDDVAINHHTVQFALLRGLVSTVSSADVGLTKAVLHDIYLVRFLQYAIVN